MSLHIASDLITEALQVAVAQARSTFLVLDLDSKRRDQRMELEKQKAAFLAEIERATGPWGRRREKLDPERVRKNISNAVTRAIEALFFI
jgi:predicted nuclease with TOPRIM domain